MSFGSAPYLPGEWAHRSGESRASGKEYEEFLEGLEGLIYSFFSAKGESEPPFYARGDFFGNREEQIYMVRKNEFAEELISAIQNWLNQHDYRNWRILIQRDLNAELPTIIYPDRLIEPN